VKLVSLVMFVEKLHVLERLKQKKQIMDIDVQKDIFVHQEALQRFLVQVERLILISLRIIFLHVYHVHKTHIKIKKAKRVAYLVRKVHTLQKDPIDVLVKAAIVHFK
jgi:hypothetical protein